MKKNAGILKTLVSAALVALLAACGGGGGGGGEGGISYSGASTPAVIDSQNAGEIAKGAYEGGAAGSALPILALQASPGGEGSPDLPRLQTLAEELKAAFFAAGADAPPTAGNARAMAMETHAGACGGMLNFQQTGETSGTITFDHYSDGDGMNCPTSPTINGSVSFSATLDAAGELQSFSMTFSALSMTMGEEGFTFNGSMTFAISPTAETFEMTMVMRDDVSGQAFKVENYRMVASGNTLDLSGRFYDPAHGFVTLSTLTPLQSSFPGDWPGAGVLRCDGANGTWVELTFLPDRAEGAADTDGDGVADLFFTYYPNAADGQEIVYQP